MQSNVRTILTMFIVESQFFTETALELLPNDQQWQINGRAHRAAV